MFNPDIDQLDLQDRKTWNIISSGRTRGIFQLESPLGRSYAKKTGPQSIEELSDLISVIRPGCLEALLEDGKTVTHHYIQRKFGKEPIEYLHPALEPILKDSYGLIIYQESCLKISRDLAGFTMAESETLRKSIGKKDTELMAKVKKNFAEKAAGYGILKEKEAEDIWDWIEKSQRYSFNAAHGIGYALTSFQSAYIKAHYPLEFYCAWLQHADEKMNPYEEIADLINDARVRDIEILPPKLGKSENNFSIQDNKIYYGLVNIKGVGEAAINKFRACVEGRTEWVDFLLNCAIANFNTTKVLASVGALPFKMSRSRQLFELEIAAKLTEREIKWARENWATDLATTLENLIKSGVPTKKRLDIIEGMRYTILHPPTDLTDDPEWIAQTEQDLLGISMTCSKVDGKENSATTTCLEYTKNPIDRPVIAATVSKVKEYTIKSGQNQGQVMCFVELIDGTCKLECTMFADKYREYGGFLTEGANLLVVGSRSKKDNSFIIQKVEEI